VVRKEVEVWDCWKGRRRVVREEGENLALSWRKSVQRGEKRFWWWLGITSLIYPLANSHIPNNYLVTSSKNPSASSITSDNSTLLTFKCYRLFTRTRP